MSHKTNSDLMEGLYQSFNESLEKDDQKGAEACIKALVRGGYTHEASILKTELAEHRGLLLNETEL